CDEPVRTLPVAALAADVHRPLAAGGGDAPAGAFVGVAGLLAAASPDGADFFAASSAARAFLSCLASFGLVPSQRHHLRGFFTAGLAGGLAAGRRAFASGSTSSGGGGRPFAAAAASCLCRIAASCCSMIWR